MLLVGSSVGRGSICCRVGCSASRGIRGRTEEDARSFSHPAFRRGVNDDEGWGGGGRLLSKSKVGRVVLVLVWCWRLFHSSRNAIEACTASRPCSCCCWHYGSKKRRGSTGQRPNFVSDAATTVQTPPQEHSQAKHAGMFSSSVPLPTLTPPPSIAPLWLLHLGSLKTTYFKKPVRDMSTEWTPGKILKVSGWAVRVS